MEEPQGQNANHLRLCLPRDVQSSLMPHTENDTHHGRARIDTDTRKFNILARKLAEILTIQTKTATLGLDSWDFLPEGHRRKDTLGSV